MNDVLAEQKGIKKLIRKISYKIINPFLFKITDIFEKENKEIKERMYLLQQENESKNVLIKELTERVTDAETQVKNVFSSVFTLNETVSNFSVNDVAKNEQPTERPPSKTILTDTENEYTAIDYFDFENRFRGSEEHIKKVQEQYLKYYHGRKNVIDIGCGRGEFLQLLKENDIPALGIDLYGKAIEWCKLKGLNVLQADAIDYLNYYEGKIDGIFGGQIVEHLTINQIIQICQACYNKLEEDAYMILETPNPTSLAIFTNAFYVDPSHVKPVHPLTLQYCAEKAGFKEVQIFYTENSVLPVKIPYIFNETIENIGEFNEAMEVVSNMLFGSQDYAIIAKK